MEVWEGFIKYHVCTCELFMRVQGFDRRQGWVISVIGLQLVSVNQSSDVIDGR